MLSAFRDSEGRFLEASGLRIGFVATPKTISGPDGVAANFGLRRLGDGWVSIDRIAARSVLRFLLRQDQAYGRARLPDDVAGTMCDDFLTWFSTDTQFFTNGRVDSPPRKDEPTGILFHAGWTPATDATFDSGVIAFGRWSGVFWIEDED